MPSYRAWFTSQVLSSSGTVTQSVGTSWLILQLTGHAVDLAWMTTATMLPVLLGSPRAGALVDRVDRRRLLATTQSAFFVLAVVLFTVSVTGSARLWSLLLIAGLTGCVSAIDAPARQVYVMDLVGRTRLASAVSLYEVVLNGSRILGPALGGVLLAVYGPSACFALNAASYLVPLWALWRYRPVDAHAVGEHQQRVSTRAGARYVWSQPALRSCLVLAAASGVLFNSTILFPLLARQAFHLGGGGYGALLASFGLGALPGALVAARSHDQPHGRLVRALALCTALAMAATAYAPDPQVAYALMGVTGFTSIWFIAAANTLVQLRAEPAMRGRVMGLWTMALPGTNPISGIAVAVIADHGGPRLAFATGAALIGLAAASGWRALGASTHAETPV